MIFRLSHIAVILSLIVATMIQPMALCMAEASCPAKSTSPLMCHGCGCCEVDSAATQCGCCCARNATAAEAAASEPVPADQETSSCCHDDATAVTSSSNATLHPAKSADQVWLPEQVIAGSEKTDTRSLSACLCGVTLPPLSDSSPRPPINELRNFEVLSYLVRAVDAEADRNAVRPVDEWDAATSLSLHFSQRVLCIWRL